MPCGVVASELHILDNGQVVLSGTTTQCQQFEVSVEALTVAKTVTADSAGNWSVTYSGSDIIANLAAFRSAKCGRTIKYSVTCKDPGSSCSDNAPILVQCDGCPPVQITIDSSGDCVNGSRTVQFHADITGGPAGVYQWDYGDGANSSSSFLPPPNANNVRTVADSHSYSVGSSAASFTLKLTLQYADTQLSCATTKELDLGACDLDCPTDVTLEVRNSSGAVVDTSRCVPSGRYRVTVVSPTDDPTLTYSWTVNGVLDASSTGRQFNVSVQSGETKTVAVSVGKPGCAALPGSVRLEDCKQPKCPELGPIDVQIGPCDSDGKRDVTFSSDATGQQGQHVSFDLTLQLAGTAENRIATGTGTGSATVSQTEHLSPGTYTVRTKTTAPRECKDTRQRDITVPSCPRPKPPDHPDDLCLALRILALIGLGCLLIGVMLLLCPALNVLIAPGAIHLVIGILIGAGILLIAIGLIAWAVVCKPTPCDWMMMLWESLVVIGLVMIYAGMCPACQWMLVGAVALIAGGGVMIGWGKSCHPSICKVTIEMIGLFTLVMNIVTVIEAVLANCVISSNWLAALIWALALAAIQAWLWYRASDNHCFRE